MIVESSSILVKSRLTALLVNYKVEPFDREEIALDIIEFIALRLNKRDDDEVFNLGLFVQHELTAFESGTMTFLDVHCRLTRAAMAARLGSIAFLRAVNFV